MFCLLFFVFLLNFSSYFSCVFPHITYSDILERISSRYVFNCFTYFSQLLRYFHTRFQVFLFIHWQGSHIILFSRNFCVFPRISPRSTSKQEFSHILRKGPHISLYAISQLSMTLILCNLQLTPGFCQVDYQQWAASGLDSARQVHTVEEGLSTPMAGR